MSRFILTCLKADMLCANKNCKNEYNRHRRLKGEGETSVEILTLKLYFNVE